MAHNSYVDQHRDMVRLAEEICSIGTHSPLRDIGCISKLRLELSRAVTAHCGSEAKLLQSIPAASLDEERRRIVSRYHTELLEWRRALVQCNCDWPPARIAADKLGFVQAFGPIVQALKARVRWEEDVFYPAFFVDCVH